MAKKVYIAGPMRGRKLFNFPAFDAAKKEIGDMGCIALSPADLDREAGFNPESLPEDYVGRLTRENVITGLILPVTLGAEAFANSPPHLI